MKNNHEITNIFTSERYTTDKMKHIGMTLLAVIIGICCIGKCGGNRMEENPKETPDPFAGVFRSKPLQDSLYKFIGDSRKMKSSDTIVFPLYDTIVYSVFLYWREEIILTGQEQTLRFKADTGAIFVMDDEIFGEEEPFGKGEMRIVGAIRRGNEILALSCYNYAPDDSLINESAFDRGLWDKFWNSNNNPRCNALAMAGSNHYKFINYKMTHGDSLVLKRKYRNRHFFEKSFSEYW